jgi:hypothetical protein
MKRSVRWTLVLAAALIAAQPVSAGPFGLGIMAGEPTGISAKLMFRNANAVDAGLAWSLDGDNDFLIQADYLYHNYDLIPVGKGRLPLYFGIGGRLQFRESLDDKIGVRIPVGLSYIFESAPFDAFVEIVPILDLNPSTEFDLAGAIGGRFYF